MTTYTSLIRAVILRPKMYTKNGTYSEVTAFLKGFVSGAANVNAYSHIVAEANFFQRWLGQKVNTEQDRSLQIIGEEDDETAFSNLAVLLECFEKEVQSTSLQDQ